MKHKKIIIPLLSGVFAAGIYLLSGVIGSESTPAETKIFFRENPPQIMTFETTYNLCGHKTVYSASADKHYKTKNEAEADYPDFETDTFAEDKITLSKSEEKYCNSHFYAILNENMIYIYSRYSGKAEYGFPKVSSRLTEEEISALEKGIDFDSKESMLSFVEDYTS